MGLMPEGAGNPYTRLDPQQVVGMLKSSGARDGDVLYAQKQKLLSQPKQLKMLGVLCMVVGAFMTVTVVLAIAGIPCVLFGWWTYQFGQKNIAAIEAGFELYKGTATA